MSISCSAFIRCRWWKETDYAVAWLEQVCRSHVHCCNWRTLGLQGLNSERRGEHCPQLSAAVNVKKTDQIHCRWVVALGRRPASSYNDVSRRLVRQRTDGRTDGRKQSGVDRQLNRPLLYLKYDLFCFQEKQQSVIVQAINSKRTLTDRISHLVDCNFIIRMLYRSL